MDILELGFKRFSGSSGKDKLNAMLEKHEGELLGFRAFSIFQLPIIHFVCRTNFA